METDEAKPISDKERVFARVATWFKDREAIEVWYTTQQVAGCGGLTPEDLVVEGRTEWIFEALDAIEAGGHY